ncbi:MAG: PIN domain-containing protein [Chloroflexota bacterium]|nr:PIN domain-containing protein [Chloroflexota bacterium]
MSRIIVLDTGVLGKITKPSYSLESDECKQWVEALIRNGDVVAIPEIVDYELRRELLRRNAEAGLRILDQLVEQHYYVKINSPAMHHAAELWAWARNRGHLTAPPDSLDADVILVAQAQLQQTPDTPVIIATTNVKHLAPFIDARVWRDI